MSTLAPFPKVLPMRQRAEVIYQLLKQRLATVMPAAMRATGIDFWLILCQEDNLDPVYTTLIPMDTWCPILQILVFYDRGDGTIEGSNISGTNTHDLYQRPYSGQLETEQWPLLLQLIAERDPQRIGINIGATQWAAGGLTHNLYQQLIARLPAQYRERLVSAEPLAIQWLSTLTPADITMYEHVCDVAHHVIGECYSRQSIIPGHTSIDDLPWIYWQRCADRGFTMAFKPYFRLVRRPALRAYYGEQDRVIRPGDLIHCDVGFQYLRFNSDHQQWAYIRLPGEETAPAELNQLLAEGNRLQAIYMAAFEQGLTGNQLLQKMLHAARQAGIPNPRIYSHSVGLFLHEPGPLIGLPWEQENNPGRGDVVVAYDSCFTMELSVRAPLRAWDDEEVQLSMEEIVVFTESGCRPLAGRQQAFYLV
ncbi:MAG: M24 family metallopeptidase [Caldilineaceae bacterium]|nr:M24 family metallopeptidase [Caldilineaceae bacterium]